MMSVWSLVGAGGLPTAPPAINPWLGLALAVFLVLLNGFFVAAEFALVKVRPTQIEPHAQRGDRRGKIAEHLITHLDAYLSATQLGITLASLALGWIGEPAFSWIIEPLIGWIPGISETAIHTISLATAFLIITVLHIVLGELAPKSVAIRRPEATTLWIAIPLYGFYFLAYPVIWLLNHSANALLRLVGVDPPSEAEAAHDAEEIRLLLASSRASRLTPAQRELLDNIFELSDRTARQIMVPRADVVYMSKNWSIDDNLALARQAGHTRFPVAEESLDRIVGMVHIKDVFRASPPLTSLEPALRQISFVPETLELDRLLRRMLDEKIHIAAVLDEFGGVSGIVTLENVIEEIVGQIQDEFDSERPELVSNEDGSWIVSGSMLVVDLETEIGIEFSERDEDTIAGVALSELGRRPAAGDRVKVGPVRLEILETRRNRITALRVHRSEGAESEDPIDKPSED